MNILYIAEDISLPGFHGGSTHVQETINALVELGHKVFVICKKNKGQKKKEMVKGISYCRINAPSGGFQKNIWFFFNLGKITEEILNKERIELVWQRNRIFGCQGIIAGKKAGAKTILEMNEPIETSEESIAFPLIKKWFLHCVKYADKVTGTHECMFKFIPKEKRLLSWHGSNPKLFNSHKKDPTISKKFSLKGKTLFYSGSFQEWHCLKNALIAFEKVQEKYPEAAFLLAGEGPQKKELEKLAKKLKVKNIHFLGNVQFERLPYHINASDVCLALFDRNYGAIKKCGYFYSPIKVHDYKACGKSVIASGIGNLKGLVKEGKNGFLVDEKSIPEITFSLANALSLSAKNQKLIAKRNILEIKETYNWKAITKRILEKL
ncbi:MAG: glycosyltransferase [Candidatus Diapherotrites archaeon]|nr:glycosyltransferase [Candidatus Diapherotrites archaeon]